MYIHTRKLLFICDTFFLIHASFILCFTYIFLLVTLYPSIMHNSTIMLNSTYYSSSIHDIILISCIYILSLIFLTFHTSCSRISYIMHFTCSHIRTQMFSTSKVHFLHTLVKTQLVIMHHVPMPFTTHILIIPTISSIYT